MTFDDPKLSHNVLFVLFSDEDVCKNRY